MAEHVQRPGAAERIVGALAEILRRVLARDWAPAVVPVRAGAGRPAARGGARRSA